MRSALIVLLVMLCANLATIYFMYNLIPTTFSSTELDSESFLIIDEGDELEAEWQYSTLNKSILEKLTNDTMVNIDFPSYNQDDIVKWDLSIVDNEDDCCRSYYREVLCDKYQQIGDYKQYITSHKYRIYKEPMMYLSSMFRDDNYFTYRLIPIEVDDFIKSLNDYIVDYEAWLLTLTKNYTLETNSFNTITKLLRNNSNYREIFSYNEKGLLYDHAIYYENQTAMEMNLIKYEIDKLEPQDPVMSRWFFVSCLLDLLLISTIIEIIIVIIQISTSDDSGNKQTLKQKKNDSRKIQSQIKDNYRIETPSGINNQKPIIKYQPCSNCQTLLDNNSRFCHNCGKQIKSETPICQYCGKLKVKDARYCVECGHIL